MESPGYNSAVQTTSNTSDVIAPALRAAQNKGKIKRKLFGRHNFSKRRKKAHGKDDSK